MSNPDEPEALWITLHSYLEIRLLGMAHFLPLIAGYTAILCLLCLIVSKKTNITVIALTTISLAASVFPVINSYSINNLSKELDVMIIDEVTGRSNISLICSIIITVLLFFSLVCQIISKRIQQKSSSAENK
jgi:glucan phosphoethanolaminetransferase (alkaline phosphatase superfamily)